jgi:hypothetical protein
MSLLVIHGMDRLDVALASRTSTDWRTRFRGRGRLRPGSHDAPRHEFRAVHDFDNQPEPIWRKTMQVKQTYWALLTAFAFAFPAWAGSPHSKANNSWITVSGTVKSPSADAFMLDYGRGQITVEMDDWDWYREGYKLVDGDEVTVHGRIDADMFEKRTIEAGSVYVKDHSTFFYASSSDEEDAMFTTAFYSSMPLSMGETRATGEVISIDGRTMLVDAGSTRVRVDTSKLPYNPLDDEGFQRIGVGDRVIVSGDLTPAFFTPRRQLEADIVITLEKDKSKQLQPELAAG